MKALPLTLIVASLIVSGTAPAAPCLKQDWAQYLALNQAGTGCTVGNDTLSDFSFNAGNSNLAAEKITAQPSGTGLVFTIEDFRVENPIQGLTSSKSFTVDFKITGKHPILALLLEMPARFMDMDHPIVNNGNASVTDMLNGFGIDFLAGRLMATKQFAPPTLMIKVEESVSVSTGMNQGASAQLRQFAVRYTTVTEPGTLLLMVSALAPMLLASRPRRDLLRRFS